MLIKKMNIKIQTNLKQKNKEKNNKFIGICRKYSYKNKTYQFKVVGEICKINIRISLQFS